MFRVAQPKAVSLTNKSKRQNFVLFLKIFSLLYQSTSIMKNILTFSNDILNWDVTHDPSKTSLNLNKIIGHGFIKVLLPINHTFNNTSLIIYYALDYTNKKILLGDLMYLIYEFYNKTKVNPSDLTFVSTAQDMYNFANTHLLEYSSNPAHLKMLRFKHFIASQKKVSSLENISDNIYCLTLVR